jgi:hypothetical protein
MSMISRLVCFFPLLVALSRSAHKLQIKTNLPELQDLTLTYVILKLNVWKEKESGYIVYVD